MKASPAAMMGMMSSAETDPKIMAWMLELRSNQSQTYDCCSAGCKQPFDQHAQRYAGQGTTSS
jgi:hypothetical protein